MSMDDTRRVQMAVARAVAAIRLHTGVTVDTVEKCYEYEGCDCIGVAGTLDEAKAVVNRVCVWRFT